MPTIEKSSRHQKAVLWEASGSHAADGTPTLLAPVELTVRWVEGRRQSLDAQGNPVAVDVTVVVDREVAVESIMWLGALHDVPDVPADLKQVISYRMVPDVKGRNFYRELSLVKYGNTLPGLD